MHSIAQVAKLGFDAFAIDVLDPWIIIASRSCRFGHDDLVLRLNLGM